MKAFVHNPMSINTRNVCVKFYHGSYELSCAQGAGIRVYYEGLDKPLFSTEHEGMLELFAAVEFIKEHVKLNCGK